MRLRQGIALALVLGAIGCTSVGHDLQTMVFTLAGGATPGRADGQGEAAQFSNPVNVVADPLDILYVADFDNGLVRRLTPRGAATTVVDQANFARPFGLALANGVLYVQTDSNDTGANDTTTGTIWRVDLAARTAEVVVRNVGRPRGMVGLPDGRIVLADVARHTLTILDPGTGAIAPLAGQDGAPGFADGTGAAAQFNRPYGLALATDGAILVADQENNRVRRVTLAGEVTTFAGSGTAGYQNGTRAEARFNRPQDVAADSLGNVFVSDNGNYRFRKIVGDQVGLLSGDGVPGFRDETLEGSRYYAMEGGTISHDDEYIYVADGTGGEAGLPYHRIRKLCIDGD